MEVELVKLAANFGAPGLLIAFMVWDRMQTAKISRERVAADLETAKALERLAERIAK